MAKKIQLKVFYTWGEQSLTIYDYGFGQSIKWDIPLLDGYDYQFLENVSKEPGTHHFSGIINPTLLREVRDFEPNAILIYGWAWKSHLKTLRFFKGKIPIYFRGDSTLLDQQKDFRGLLRKLFLKWVYSHVDKAFYVGNANKKYYNHLGLTEEQLVFAPHAIDNHRFGKIEQQKTNKIREKLYISSSSIIVLFAGKLEPKKAPFLLLKAFKQLANLDVHLLFVGNGELEKELKTMAGNLSNVHFIDFQNQSEMPAIYQTCDLFCLPSKGPKETWGLAVNEAMAAGKAVLVSTKTGCASDLVKPGVNGEIFKSDDVNDLTQKLKELTSSKRKLVELGIQSLKIIKDWTFDRQVKAMVDTVYNDDAK
ncbi:glycosyltransferase family 4 protein [Pedobacter aquatilis]|uniref:glycosyltransferase family 4 protein n=1 Tax=Pedobacter aquatilis TaxID=351343 RepID=UPI0025B464C8|nr:glycosyltransferase family 4 protein [Pedobacter aquatilis]MDN3586189.1 glycosyltransferase family 4 protein [Pedobacter aquatilis]